MTNEQTKAMVDYIKASAEFHKKVTPNYVRVNELYVNQFFKSEEVKQVQFGSEGTYVDYNGIIPFHSIPVIVDNTIETYEFEY